MFTDKISGFSGMEYFFINNSFVYIKELIVKDKYKQLFLCRYIKGIRTMNIHDCYRQGF